MRKSRIAAGLGVVVATTALAACGGVNTGVSSTDTGAGQSAEGSASELTAVPESCLEDGALIGVLLPNQTNPYYVAMKTSFEEGTTEHGFKAEVAIADDDDAQQLAQAEAMLQKNLCALALNPVKSEPAAAIVKAANDKNVPVFTVNVIVDEAALDAQGAHIVQYLGADNRAGGAQIGEQVLADMGEDADLSIGLITEPDERPVVIRDEGFADAISVNPNAEVVASVNGKVKAEVSLNVGTEMLQGNPTMNVIFASTGPATQGGLEAVKASGRDTKIYGFCAPDLPLTDMYPACVAQEPEDYGRRVTEQVRKFVDGETVEAEILRPLKMYVTGETPAPGEVG